MIEGLVLVEPGHFNRKFDRCAISIEIKRSIVALRDRDHARVNLRSKWPVYFHLFIAGSFSFRHRRISEVQETDDAVALQRATALEKNRRRMRVEPTDQRTGRPLRHTYADAHLHPPLRRP